MLTKSKAWNPFGLVTALRWYNLPLILNHVVNFGLVGKKKKKLKMERNYQDKQHKGQRMKALTFEKELDDFLERVLRQESVGRRRNRFLLCRLWQVDRRNKRRKSFGNLLLTKSLIWAKSFRVWESFERLSCTIESISARHCPPPS